MALAAGTPVKRRPAGARADSNRRAIKLAACDAFLAVGFDASLDTISAAANVSKVTLYNHFGSKEALFIAVIGDELEAGLAAPVEIVESRLAKSTHPRDDLIDACRAWVAGIASPRMIALRNLVAGELRRFPELGATWQEHGPERFHPVIADALRELVRRRQLTIPDVDVAVLQLSGLVVSPSLVYGAYGRPPTRRTTERLVVAGVDMFLDHYRYRAKRADRH